MPQDWLNTWQGQQNAAIAAQAPKAPGALDAGPLGGFVASAWSSIPEMFGQNPTPAAETFRTEHPWLGVASELVGTAIPYGGVFKLSELPAAAKLLETGVAKASTGFGLAKTGINAVDNPIFHAALKETVRYAPFELARLGVGLATAPSDNYGNLMADVGLSTLLAGGFGGIGGFFKAGGKLLPKEGRVAGADIGLAPTFELRMSQAPESQLTGDIPKLDWQAAKTAQVLDETPYMNVPKGAPARYVQDLEGGTPEGDAFVNTLFRARTNKEMTKKISQLGVDEQQQVVAAAGFQDLTDLAANVRYPRLITINNPRAAGAMAKALDGADGLQYVDSNVVLGREANSGLWVFGKKIKAADVPEGASAPKRYGAAQIAEGDQWLIGKTDKPQLFAPQAHKIAEGNVADWSKYREAYQPGLRNNVFDQAADVALDAMTVHDYRGLQQLNKATWTQQMADRLGKKLGETTGLANSKQLKDTADFLYDAFQPTMFKEARNPVFGRLYGLLRNNIAVGDEIINKMVKGMAKFEGSPLRAIAGGLHFDQGFDGFDPVSKLWGHLWESSRGEFDAVVRAAQSQTPAEDLAKLTANGEISQLATDTYKQLQQIDNSFWQKVMLPAVSESPELQGKFELLDGYILPRVFKGDHYSQVVDELGRPQWLAVGKNAGAAQAEANAMIEEAKSRGLNWSIGKEYLGGAKHAVEINDLNAIDDLVTTSIGKSAETKDIVQSALRRIDAAKAAKRPALSAKLPAQLTHERTGAAGSPDLGGYSLDDVIRQSEQHYRRLARFAGYHTWKQRWGQEAFDLSKTDHTLFNDLMRKGQQFLGIEGQYTQALNNMLKPLFGNLLGSKAATRIANGTNKLIYNWNLAIANPTFALLNALQPLQTLLPSIAFLTKAPAEDIAAHYHILPLFDGAGKPRGIGGFSTPIKMMGAGLKYLKAPPPELKEMLERATTDGTLTHSQVNEWVGPHSASSQTIRDTFKHEGGWAGIQKIATYMAEKSENFSRMLSATTMYQLGKSHFGLEGEALYRFMQRGVYVTNYGYSVVDRSRIFTGPVGSMFGLFKNWQFNFIGQMMQYAGVGMQHGVWSPFLWQGASALALGGLGATPLLGLADGLAKWYGDSPSSFEWLQEHWSNSADEIYYGLPAFFGASLQSSAAIPGTDVRNELANMTNFVFLERMKAAGKALGDAWQLGVVNNENPLRNANVRDEVLGAVAPRAVFKAISALEGDYIKSMGTGYPQMRDVGPSVRLFQALGMNPLEVARQQTAAKELYQNQQETRSNVQALGKAYAAAMQNGDSDGMQRVIDRTLVLQVPLSSVMSSAATRLRRETQQDSLSRFSGAEVQRYRMALGN